MITIEPNIYYVLLSILGASFIILLLYQFIMYRRIYANNKKVKTTTNSYPPLSVIITVKEVPQRLSRNLPYILNQDYSNFEVIIVNENSDEETNEVIMNLEQTYKNLHHTFIPDSTRYVSTKKLAVSLGIRASHYDWLVFTEIDSYPSSDQWLKKMSENFSDNTDIVIGYSNYEKKKGIFARYITFDMLFFSMRYLGAALLKCPYTGFGHNLCYRKSLFANSKGFSSHLQLQRGEDDLFINSVANSTNTKVETSPESVVKIEVPDFHQTWKEEKLSYAVTSHFYKGISRYIMGFDSFIRYIFLLSVAVNLTISIIESNWIITGLVSFVFIFIEIITIVTINQTAKSMNERRFYLSVPLFLFIRPMKNLNFKIHKMFGSKKEFMRKIIQNA